MNLEILKLIQGLLKPDILSNFTLNKEIEELNSHISTLKMNNINVDPFLAKFENLCYQKQFGFNKEKYDFFHSQKSIKNHFSEFQLKKMSLYTYKVGDSFKVIMGIGDKIFNSMFIFFGIISFAGVILLLLNSKPITNLYLLSSYYQIFTVLVLLFFSAFILINFTAPMVHVRKFNKLYTTS